MTKTDRMAALGELRARVEQERASPAWADAAEFAERGRVLHDAMDRLARGEDPGEAPEWLLDELGGKQRKTPTPESIVGHEHGHLWNALVGFAGSLDVQIVEREHFATDRLNAGSPDKARGEYDPNARQIRVRAGMGTNERVRTLTHELAHALVERHTRGRDWGEFREEIIVEATTMLALRSAGMDTSAFSVPYITGWTFGALGEAEVLDTHAFLILRCVAQLEDALRWPAAQTSLAVAA